MPSTASSFTRTMAIQPVRQPVHPVDAELARAGRDDPQANRFPDEDSTRITVKDATRPSR
jgi:hypothetical protein